VNGDHRDNRAANLWETPAQNNRRKREHGTLPAGATHHYGCRTHCLNGHEFTPANTYHREAEALPSVHRDPPEALSPQTSCGPPL
jgi:hypothetical protein